MSNVLVTGTSIEQGHTVMWAGFAQAGIYASMQQGGG
jgi:hypothetical protein